MRTNQAAIDIIKYYEGIEDGQPDTPGLDPYADPIGIPTIGYGTTIYPNGNRVTMDDPPISQEQADEYLSFGMRGSEKAVRRLVTAEVTENMFGALVSFTYNLGSGNLQSSTLRMKLNRGEYEDAADEFPKWRKAGGRVLAGLVKRRAAEMDLFLAE